MKNIGIDKMLNEFVNARILFDFSKLFNIHYQTFYLYLFSTVKENLICNKIVQIRYNIEIIYLRLIISVDENER